MPRRRTALPTVVLVGRPNVGKSTLFNRMAGRRRAIVTPVPGTTRDLIVQAADWRRTAFELVDTGGMFGPSQDPLYTLVAAKGHQALARADLAVFVVDGREGRVAGDEEIAATLRAADTPVILAINKMDDRRAADRALELYQLGFDPVAEISAEHGQGVADLLDEIVARLGARRAVEAGVHEEDGVESDPGEPEAAREIVVAVVGRPNVGKSSLVNRLLREERVLVSEVPGTTRDAIDVPLRWHRRDFRIVDTAGIRRPGRVARAGHVEAISVVIARRAIQRADVVVVVIDASAGATGQDAAIAGEADRLGRGIVIAANKWDLVKPGGPDATETFDEELRRQLKFLDYAPVVRVSATTGERVGTLLELVDRVVEARRRRVPTAELNRFVQAVTAAHPPPSPGRREVRVLYAAQTGVEPPSFVIFTNVVTSFHFSYERFLKNRLRETFGFVGSPLRLHVRRRAGGRAPGAGR